MLFPYHWEHNLKPEEADMGLPTHENLRSLVHVEMKLLDKDAKKLYEGDSITNKEALQKNKLEKILSADNEEQETSWNKLLPKKVNIFVWRALRGRLSVRVELDRRCIDLDSVLCPNSNNSAETYAHIIELALWSWLHEVASDRSMPGEDGRVSNNSTSCSE
ncbi:RNA-directed DNA polymerase, eukaryota, reverse transcriptase zinc-binding domain protein [Tanacetum coccineum]